MTIINKLATLEKEAADFGFKWERADQIKEQIISELAEIDVHLVDKDQARLQEELGDLLHAAFSLTVFCGFDPATTLQQSVDKFEKRLNGVKALATRQGLTSLNGKSFDELMSFWEQAKQM